MRGGEQGSVSCSPGFLNAVDVTPSAGPCGAQGPVPFGVGYAVSAENPRAWGGGVSEGVAP